jgi:hypothetical protein
MFAVVSFGAPHVLDFVSGPGESAFHGLVRHPPITAVDVEVAVAVLEEDAKRFRFGLANERVIAVATAQTDVCSDRGKDAAKIVGALPGSGERADRAAAAAADATVVAVLAQHDGAAVGSLLFFNEWQQLLENEARVGIAEAIVFEAAVEAVERVGWVERFHHARRGGDVNGNRHFAFVNEVVEDGGRFVLDAVLVHPDARGFRGVILLWDVDGDVPRGAGEGFGTSDGELEDVAFGNAGLFFRVRSEGIGVLGIERDGSHEEECGGGGERQEAVHAEGRAI